MRRTLLAAIVAAIASLLVVPAAAGWSWPVDGPVLRSFSLGADVYAAGQHRGVDVGAAVGEPVRAPVAGVVSFVGSVPGGGRALTIQTGDGYAVTLLQLGSVDAARGATLAEGDLVGRVGESADGVTTVPHVHLGVRVAAEPDGYVDPLGLLPARTAAPAPEPAPAPVPTPAPVAAVPAAAAAAPWPRRLRPSRPRSPRPLRPSRRSSPSPLLAWPWCVQPPRRSP